MNEPQISMTSGQSSEIATTRNSAAEISQRVRPICICRKLAPRPRMVA